MSTLLVDATLVVVTGIVVFAHGSRIEPANEAVRRVAAEAARAGGYGHVEAAFLELGEPGLEGAVVRLMERGVGRVLVVPYFLTLGIHLERDLPAIVKAIEERHPGVQVRVTPPLDGHPGLVTAVADRAKQGVADWQPDAASPVRSSAGPPTPARGRFRPAATRRVPERRPRRT